MSDPPRPLPDWLRGPADQEDYLTQDLAQLLIDYEPWQALEADLLHRISAAARDAVVKSASGQSDEAKGSATLMNAFQQVIQMVHSAAGRRIEFELDPIFRRIPTETSDASHQEGAPAPHQPSA